MRHQSKTYITATLAVMTLTGCGNEANEPVSSVPQATPSFTAIISDAQTRAVDSQWDAGDEIGINCEGRKNVAYRTSRGDGNFTVKTSGNQIYFQNDDEVSFTAYYPWNALAEETTVINADTRDQARQKNFDFLWASSSGSKARPNVSLTFSHKMVRLSLSIKPGTGMTYDELKNAVFSMNGFRHSGSFNISNGSAIAGNQSELWSFTDFAQYNVTAGEVSFSMIFFPQTFATPMELMAAVTTADNKSLSLKANIDFTAANRGKDGSNAKNEWVAGRQYNLSLTLNKTEITVASCAINPWAEVTGSEITVD